MSALRKIPGRRGWCPGVRRPMETGDGLLVRVHPPGGVLPADAARLVARAAIELGNGLLDVTARGNVQIRGVRPETYPALLARLDAAGLAEPEGEGPGRLTLVSPLAGLDPGEAFDSAALATAIESAGAGIAGLPAKVFVAVDGGGAMPLLEAGADVILAAVPGPAPVAVAIAGPSGPVWIGTTSFAAAPSAVRAILAAFAALRGSGATPAGRVRDIGAEFAAELSADVPLAPVAQPLPRPPAPRAGLVRLGTDRFALIAALPFGRCDAGTLVRVADWSERHGTGEVRPSPTRGFVLPGLRAAETGAVMDLARAAGLIVDSSDPRLAITACPGAPACASAAVPAPADAARIAGAAGRIIGAGASLHVSGCSKGCARPGPADLTLVGLDDGCYGLVVRGSARDAPLARLPLSRIIALLPDAQTPDDLARSAREATR